MFLQDWYFTTLVQDPKHSLWQKINRVNAQWWVMLQSILPLERLNHLHVSSHKMALKSSSNLSLSKHSWSIYLNTWNCLPHNYPRLGLMTFTGFLILKGFVGTFLSSHIQWRLWQCSTLTFEMGFAMLNWALAVPAGNNFVPITDIDYSYGREEL